MATTILSCLNSNTAPSKGKLVSASTLLKEKECVLFTGISTNIPIKIKNNTIIGMRQTHH